MPASPVGQDQTQACMVHAKATPQTQPLALWHVPGRAQAMHTVLATSTLSNKHTRMHVPIHTTHAHSCTHSTRTHTHRQPCPTSSLHTHPQQLAPQDPHRLVHHRSHVYARRPRRPGTPSKSAWQLSRRSWSSPSSRQRRRQMWRMQRQRQWQLRLTSDGGLCVYCCCCCGGGRCGRCGSSGRGNYG